MGWGVLGGLSGLGLEGLIGGKKGGGSKEGTVGKKYPMGTANYFDDSYLPLLQGMQGIGPGQGTATGLADILANFKGSQKNLHDFLQVAAPFLAAQLGGTKAFKDVQRWEDYNKPMQQFGSAAGQIGAGARAGTTAAGQSLARSGMGRSGAMASMAGNMAAGARTNQANLYSQLFQQGLENRANFSGNALDAHRMLSTLALGHNPAPRQKGPSTDMLGPAIAGVTQGAAMLPFVL